MDVQSTAPQAAEIQREAILWDGRAVEETGGRCSPRCPAEREVHSDALRCAPSHLKKDGELVLAEDS